MLEKRMKKARILIAICLGLAVVGLFFLFPISFSQNENGAGRIKNILRVSFISWRVDGSGDFRLPKLGEGVYTLKKAVKTSGIIGKVTVSAEFKGRVTLEISANDGKDYTPVVYGVPLIFNTQ